MVYTDHISFVVHICVREEKGNPANKRGRDNESSICVI
jgi:hypothetical protein